MNPTQNVITRNKTIILEANEKQSNSNGPGSFQTILSKGVDMKNGDTVQIMSAYIDTTQIDVGRIEIKEDTELSWRNGLWLKNQQLETYRANRCNEVDLTLTDNKPYPLCRFRPAGDDITHYGEFVCRSEGFKGDDVYWGDIDIVFQYTDANGNIARKTVHIPPIGPVQGDGEQNSQSFELNIMAKTNSVVVIDPNSSYPIKVTPSAGVSDEYSGGGSKTRGVRWPVSPYKGITTTVVTSGLMIPVTNRGSFILKQGNYEPAHLAKILTDNFTELPRSRLRNQRLEATAPFPLTPSTTASTPGYALWGNTVGGGTTSYFVPSIESFKNLPYPYAAADGGADEFDQRYVGWTVEINYPVTIVSGSDTTWGHNTFSILQIGDTGQAPGTPKDEYRWYLGTIPTDDSIPVGAEFDPLIVTWDASIGGSDLPWFFLSPPMGETDGGSTFLQSTDNYTGQIDGINLFAYVDTSNPINTQGTNIMTFEPASIAKQPDYAQLMGSNQMEIIWDTDINRFKFNYIHTPVTVGATFPGLITQTNAVSIRIDAAEDPQPTYVTRTNGVSRDPPPNGRGDPNPNVNEIITNAIGGVWFQDLQPASFWEDILGFTLIGDGGLIPPLSYATTAFEYISTQLETLANPSSAQGTILPLIPGYDTIIPHMPLVEGVNITAQRVSLATITGVQSDYTQSITFDETSAPSNPNGRVAISDIDGSTVAILAGANGLQIGVQDSGYYLIDIDIGCQYNEMIGSASRIGSFTRNIRMVVDRFYAKNAYTSGQSNGVSYIHYGNPVRITSVDVRITNSDGSEISLIGDDNSVFLQILKTIVIIPEATPSA